MFFSTSPLPFCRQLINNKQLGDIEVAIRSIKGSVDRAKAKAKKAYDMGYLEGISQGDPDVILSSSPKQMDKRYKTLAKKKQKLNKPTSAKERSPRNPAKGGGKIYTSMDKKYGGGIFPRKGNM